MIDIIIPIYNAGILLKRCIDSLLNQTDKIGYTIYLIDDGSTDISVNICDEYALKYKNIKVFHKKNGGCVDARQYGIDSSKGEYIVFVDADDFVENDYIVDLKKALQNSADYYILNNKRNYIVNDGYYIEKDFLYDGYISKKQIYEWYLSSKIGAVWDKIYVRKIIDNNKIRFDEKITHGDDFYINIKYLQSVNTVYCQNTASYVHIIDSAVSVCSHDASMKRLYDLKLLRDSVIDMLPSDINEVDIIIFKKSILNAYFNAIKLMLEDRSVININDLDRFISNEYTELYSIKKYASLKEKIYFWFLFNKKYRIITMIQKIYNTRFYKYLLDRRYRKIDKLIKLRGTK